jgi:predicted patatin/cPLA2 family phospholipase
MRGVVSIGMVSVFEDLGFLDAFDSIHGSSAGACAGVYFSTGQSHLGASIYYEDINNRTFINPRRLVCFKRAMNVDFLVDDVVQRRKVLDVNKILVNPGFLHIVTTDASSGDEVVFNQFRDRNHFFKVIKASICLPVVAGRSIDVDGRKLIDGGIVQQIAMRSAVNAGATHAIALMTRRPSELKRPEAVGSADFGFNVLRAFYGERLANVYRARGRKINETIRAILDGRAEGVAVDAILPPSDAVKIGRLTIDGRLLSKAYADARRAALGYLGEGGAEKNCTVAS